MKTIIYVFSFGISFLIVACFSSCKDESCSEYHIRELNQDTALISYTGFETFKFIIEDSLGNFIDSVTFKGEGKRKYILGSDRQMHPCGDVLHDHQNMDITYQNKNNFNQMLIFNVRKTEVGSDLNIILNVNKENKIIYKGRGSYFFNSFLTAHHDTITIKNIKYFTVIQFTTEELNYKSTYFGKYDGILSLEETPNRIWYKIN